MRLVTFRNAVLATLGLAVSCGGSAHSLGGADFTGEESGGAPVFVPRGAGGSPSPFQLDSGLALYAGSPGLGGSPGAAGSPGAGGALLPSECSPNPCPSVTPDSVGIEFSGCCISPISECGIDTSLVSLAANVPGGCQRKAQPGLVDGQCADTPVQMFSLVLKGCCRPDGTCGTNLDLLGLGCVVNSAAAPPPRFCSPDGRGPLVDGGRGGNTGSGGHGTGGNLYPDGGTLVDGGLRARQSY